MRCRQSTPAESSPGEDPHEVFIQSCVLQHAGDSFVLCMQCMYLMLNSLYFDASLDESFYEALFDLVFYHFSFFESSVYFAL